VDESCLPSKIYMGHVHALLGQCDYILTPRWESFGPEDKVCVKFNGLYDIVHNTFPDAPLLDYNVNTQQGRTEARGFAQLGRRLGCPAGRVRAAYRQARQAQAQARRQLAARQAGLMAQPGPKLLIVAHGYNAHDNLLGRPVAEQVRRQGGVPLFADHADPARCRRWAQAVSPALYWTFNKELLGAIKLYEGALQGVIFVTAFPCGQDALVNDLAMRRLSLPALNLILDELWADAGLETRVESFMDIVRGRG
jgi:predicted nucleotide-binding protein (sugar kinase/HSP70/actin superfamily)